MSKSGKIKDRPQCIVLPFQPDPSEDFNGVGLALHFLLGNVMALHTGLKECWFGWRANKIFPEKTDLKAYCRGKEILVDLHQVSTEQNVRFWLYGKAGDRFVTVFLFDAADNEQSLSKRIPVSYSDGLVEFRRIFLDHLAACGHPFPAKQVQPALWAETISMQGMDILGRALESFYLHSAYSGKGKIDSGLFEKAAAVAPNSFMVQDILGWASYRSQDYRAAKESFLRALRSNPNGIGAMSGLIWCGVYTGDREEAQFWAARKAEVRGEDIKEARQKALNRMKKLN
jgi:tetratricopeptide (TPR) repeat protein